MLNFEQLQALAAHATAPGKKFYRTLYGLADGAAVLAIQSIADWERLPVVTKDALIDMPLSDRSFIPVGSLDHIRASSGTSGKPPLFSPRTRVRHMHYRLQYHDFKNPFMSYTVPLMPYWHERFQRMHDKDPRVIVYDPKYPAVSVRLAALAGVDAMSLFIYHLRGAGEEMKRQGINERIRFLEITGETCSRDMYEYLRTTFPNAAIVQSYGASEVEDVHIGMPCKPIDGSEPLAVYHPKATHYLEIVDSATGAVLEPKPGVEGELLITAYPGEPSAFPLVRFKIGDTVRVVDERCPHGLWSFTVVGRSELDFIKIMGGVVRADEAERALSVMRAQVDRFELHYFERTTDLGPKPQLELRVALREQANLQAFGERFAATFRIAPTYTYATGVAEGRYLPLLCTELTTPAPVGKTKKLFKH